MGTSNPSLAQVVLTSSEINTQIDKDRKSSPEMASARKQERNESWVKKEAISRFGFMQLQEYWLLELSQELWHLDLLSTDLELQSL